jgi:plastocyanin
MKRTFAITALLALAAPSSQAEEPGRVCIMKTSSVAAGASEPLSAGSGASTGGFVFVQVDNLPKRHVSPKEAADFTGLSLTQKHWVRLYDDAGTKQLVSFPFTFEAGRAPTLCMAQNPMYRTWMLEASGINCTCPDVSPIVTVTTIDSSGTEGGTVLTETAPAAPKEPKDGGAQSAAEFTFVSVRRGRPITIHFNIRQPAGNHEFAVFDQTGRKIIEVLLPPSPDKNYSITFREEGQFDFRCLTHPTGLIGQFIVLPSKSTK